MFSENLYRKNLIFLFILLFTFCTTSWTAVAKTDNNNGNSNNNSSSSNSNGKKDYIDFDIIVPLNPDYDDCPVKQIDVSEGIPSYMLEVVDKDGYYYPTLSLAIGGGQGNIKGGVPATKIMATYYISDNGTISQDPEKGEPFARIYRLENHEVNNVNINKNDKSNVKYEMTYISDYTFADGSSADVYNVVHSAERYLKNSQEHWLRLPEDGGLITDDPANYLVLVNSMNRTYMGEIPSIDKKEKIYTWGYYQDNTGKLTITPIDPEKDDDVFTICNSDNNTLEEGSFSFYDAFSMTESHSGYNVLISGKAELGDVYNYTYSSSDDQYGEFLKLSSSTGELDSIGYSIYPHNSDTELFSGSTDEDIDSDTYTFSFYENYKDLLDDESETFDIELRGSVADSSKKASVNLYNIQLPEFTLNNISVVNNSTEALWKSFGVSSSEYSKTVFEPHSGKITQASGDGNYAKKGDKITIKVDYAADEKLEGLLDKKISLVYGNSKKILCLDGNGECVYDDSKEDDPLFTGNGIAYLVLSDVDNIGSLDKNEMIQLLYIDNRDPKDEVASTTKEYINDNSCKVSHSTDEDSTDSNALIAGYTGTRAYIDIFSYDSDKSDIPQYANSINAVPYTGDTIGSKYYKAVFGNSYDIDIDSSGHTNDGNYHIHKVMAIDKAGNMEDIDATELSKIAAQMDSSGDVCDYYIDTISPIISASLKKTKDLYPELGTAFGLPAELPFKNGDQVEVSINIEEYNLAISSLVEDDSIDNIDLTDAYSFPIRDATKLTFTVENLSTGDSGEDYEFFTATATDKAGNSSTAPVTGQLINLDPSNLALELYEDHWNWKNDSTGIIGDSSLVDSNDSNYRFSKGSISSGSSKPDIYITGFTKNTDSDSIYIVSINVDNKKRYYKHGNNRYKLEKDETSVNLKTIDSIDDDIDVVYLYGNGKHTVKIIPYSISGKKGNEYVEDVLIDTDVNSDTKMMSTGTYIPSSKKYKFKLDFSNISEFAGLTGYKINKIVSELAGSTTTTYDNSSSTSYTSLSTTPSTSLTNTPGLETTIELGKDDLTPGARSTLYADVIDALGSKKQIKFTLLVPEPSVRLKAKANGSKRVIVSDIKIIGETNKNKGFEVESYGYNVE